MGNMEIQTNDAFLKSKISRFIDFLSSILKTRLNSARFTEFKDKIEQLRTLDTGHFIIHVTESMVPYRTNIPQYVAKMLAEHALETKDLTTDELNKMGRYVEMFIEVVSQ